MLGKQALRALSIDVLEACRTRDPKRLHRARLRLKRHADYCQKSCHDGNPAQEDHRGFAVGMMATVERLELDLQNGVEDPDALRDLILLLLANKPPTPQEERHYLQLFPWYRPAAVDGREGWA